MLGDADEELTVIVPVFGASGDLAKKMVSSAG